MRTSSKHFSTSGVAGLLVSPYSTLGFGSFFETVNYASLVTSGYLTPIHVFCNICTQFILTICTDQQFVGL